MSMEHWWNDTGGKANYWEKNLSKGTMPEEVRLGHVFLNVFRLPRVCMPQHVVITRKNAELYSFVVLAQQPSSGPGPLHSRGF